jgi:hypothetical protein
VTNSSQNQNKGAFTKYWRKDLLRILEEGPMDSKDLSIAEKEKERELLS